MITMTKSTKNPRVITNPLGNMYSTEEIAQILNVSRRTVQRMIQTGEIAAIGKQRNYRVPEAELKSWMERELESNRAKRSADAPDSDNTKP
jgi:excisionase family DNA binding protein